MLAAGDYVIGYSQNSSDSRLRRERALRMPPALHTLATGRGMVTPCRPFRVDRTEMFGPNFQFGDGSVAPVLESSSTFVLLLLLVAAIFGLKLRFTKKRRQHRALFVAKGPFPRPLGRVDNYSLGAVAHRASPVPVLVTSGLHILTKSRRRRSGSYLVWLGSWQS